LVTPDNSITDFLQTVSLLDRQLLETRQISNEAALARSEVARAFLQLSAGRAPCPEKGFAVFWGLDREDIAPGQAYFPSDPMLTGIDRLRELALLHQSLGVPASEGMAFSLQRRKGKKPHFAPRQLMSWGDI
jgi:hypothetical protein